MHDISRKEISKFLFAISNNIKQEGMAQTKEPVQNFLQKETRIN